MGSKYKKISILIFCLFLFLIGLFPNHVLGSTSGYTIKNYNVDINVNENNSLDITETITVNFTEEKHGIIRKIPTSNSIVRNDGSKAFNIALVKNIKTNDPCTKRKEDGYVSLKLGNKNETLLGEHTYIIKYKYYLLGEDGLNDADELYFNIIGTEWDTSIENATFKVTMPKEFDSSLLGFSSGSIGAKDSSNVQYSVDGNIITGSIKNSLQPYQGVTIRLTLPDEYFFSIITLLKKITKFIVNHYMIIILCLGTFFLLRAFILWFKYGKDEKTIETVEFYPPQGYTSAEIGYMYNGKVTNEAIISTLIQLANCGYIKIEEVEGKGILKRKTFKITKLKPYSENNYIEKTFFEGLFSYGEPNPDTLDLYIKRAEQGGEKITKRKIKQLKNRLPIEVVTEKDLKNKFYITINKIKKHLEKNKNKIYEKNDTKQSKIKSMISKISFLALFNIFFQSDINILYKILTVVVLQFSVSKLINKIFSYSRKTVGDIISFIIFTGIASFFIVQYILPMMLQSTEAKNFYIIISTEMIALIILYFLMSKRTNYGTIILGQIKGFRRFLENAEKGQLEILVEENPEYFYDILPYTYALGVSKKWINQFETIAIRPPDWFDTSYNIYNTSEFTHFLDNTVRDVSNSMTFGAREPREPQLYNFLTSLASSDDRSSSWNDRSSSGSGGGSSGRGSGGRRRKLMVEKRRCRQNNVFFYFFNQTPTTCILYTTKTKEE